MLIFTTKKKMSTHQLLTVQSIDRLTPSAVAITFEVPETLAPDFAFKAGQYLSLEAMINDQAVRRSYSLCSAPHEGRLTVGIKKVPNGVFSSFANDELAVGHQLAVAPRKDVLFMCPTEGNRNCFLLPQEAVLRPFFQFLKPL